MITLLRNWKGSIDINDKHFDTVAQAAGFIATESLDDVTIKLSSNHVNVPVEQPAKSGEQRILVKSYMTRKSSDDFDFMKKWNNDIPMPIRRMQGTVEKTTRGMVYMKLHGFAKKTIVCQCCGKELTNPVSRAYGVGPICLGKMGITEEIDNVAGITEALEKITWEGWIIKSAILEEEEV